MQALAFTLYVLDRQRRGKEVIADVSSRLELSKALEDK